MTFAVSMGVVKEDETTRRELEEALGRRERDIARVLEEFGVPQLSIP